MQIRNFFQGESTPFLILDDEAHLIFEDVYNQVNKTQMHIAKVDNNSSLSSK